MKNEFLTVVQAAVLCGFSPALMYRMIYTHRLPTVNRSHSRDGRIDPAELRKFLERHGVPVQESLSRHKQRSKVCAS